jgi:glycosyltransferase involved in cell wall biosynthesis
VGSTDGTGTQLRIALVAPPLLPVPPVRYAGTERIVAALADGLTARGHVVTLVASGDSTASGRLVPVVPRAVWTERYRPDVAPYQLMSAEAARKHADRFDLMHAHLETAGFALARSVDLPVVTTFHQRVDLPGTYDCLNAYPDLPLVAISDSQRRWHPHLNWVATIPHGLPLGLMPFELHPGDYLALVGRASPEKGVAEAIDVARRAGMRLRIAAKAIEPAEIELVDQVIRPALAQGVEFLGEIDASQRDPLLAGALATLMLGAWPEPFGLVAIESLAAGTPVVARRAGALPEIVEHGVDGFLVDDIDEAVLAVRLARDLDRIRIRQRALDRFNVERMAADYERVYLQLVAGTWTGSSRQAAPPPPTWPPTRLGHDSREGGRLDDAPEPKPATIKVVMDRSADERSQLPSSSKLA